VSQSRALRDPFSLIPLLRGPGTAESLTTVLVAFAANLLIAVAKSVAAVATGSASLVAEAAHSWADAGNEVFLLIATRRSRRPADRAHPLGHGREAYVWSLFAALGLFVAGGAVSVTHGIQELVHPEPADRINQNRRFLVGVEADPRVRTAVLKVLLDLPEVARVTYLRLEIVGPRTVFVTGDVDLTGDETESHVAVRLRALEEKFCVSPAVVGAVLSLSAPDEPSLRV